MSATICPSCLGRSFEAGHCANCGFSSGEYKLERTALPLGSQIGSYRIGAMKSVSRQSQVYTGVHSETASPVIIEEFFPAKVAVRTANNEEIDLASDNPELIRRFEQGCLLIESSNQKRPLKRIETVWANNTIYSVFEPVQTMPAASQCEMMADNPYYFRDQNGLPLMTINTLPIPPMPQERGFNPEQYREQSWLQGNNEGFRSQLITENETRIGREKRKYTIIGIAAALVLLIGIGIGMITDPFHIIRPETPPNPENTNQALTPMPTEEPTSEPTPTPTPEPTPEPTPTASPVPNELSREAFKSQLVLVPAENAELKGFPVKKEEVERPDSQLKVAEDAPETTISGEAKVHIKDGKVLFSVPDRKTTNLYFVVIENGTYYRIDAGTMTGTGNNKTEFTPNPNLKGLGFKVWKSFEKLELVQDEVLLLDIKDTDSTWLETLYVAEEYKGDKFVAYTNGTVSLQGPEETSRPGSVDEYINTDSRELTALSDPDSRLRLVITTTDNDYEPLQFPVRKYGLTAEEMVGHLRLTNPSGEKLESRKMKKDYKNIDFAIFTGNDESDLNYPEDQYVSVRCCRNTKKENSLLAEAKEGKDGKILYVVINDEKEKIDCRVKVGKIIQGDEGETENTHKPWEDPPAELVLLLWKDVGDLKKGARMSFENNGQDWLNALMADVSINEVLFSWEGVLFDLQEDPVTGKPVMVAENRNLETRKWELSPADGADGPSEDAPADNGQSETQSSAEPQSKGPK